MDFDVADSLHWRIQGGHPLLRPKISRFHAVFGKIRQNHMLTPPWRVSILSYRESWIRPWLGWYVFGTIHLSEWVNYCFRVFWHINLHINLKHIQLFGKLFLPKQVIQSNKSVKVRYTTSCLASLVKNILCLERIFLCLF